MNKKTTFAGGFFIILISQKRFFKPKPVAAVPDPEKETGETPAA